VVGVDIDDELQLAGRHALHDPILKAVGLDQRGFGPALAARLPVERADGTRSDYRVIELDVLDKRDTWVTKNEGPARLTLITCWPFDALRAGGPQRYVVIAKRL